MKVGSKVVYLVEKWAVLLVDPSVVMKAGLTVGVTVVD